MMKVEDATWTDGMLYGKRHNEQHTFNHSQRRRNRLANWVRLESRRHARQKGYFDNLRRESLRRCMAEITEELGQRLRKTSAKPYP
jgi:hypothetical protein